MGDEQMTVLAVDDEPDVAATTAEYLERELSDVEVLTGDGPDEGMERLDAVDVDCVVSDYDMPGMDGVEFLQRVREEHPDLPFVLFTGKGSEEVASEAISAGVTDYLQKETSPSQYTVLANRIENAVERYRSQRALAETERKLSEIAAKTEDVLFMFDGDWSEIQFINAAYEDMWGGSIEALEENALSFLQHVHPDDRELVLDKMAEIASGEEETAVFRLTPGGGEEDVRWVRAESQPIVEDGEVVRIVGYVRDVTELREHEQELEETTQRLRAVIEASPDAIMVVDRDARVTMWNPAAEEIFGWSEDEVLGEPNPMIPHDFEEEFQTHKERVFDGESVVGVETTRVTASGERIDVSLSTAPVRDASGEIVGGMAVIEDITERKEREHRLERYERIVGNIPVGVFRTDADGTLVDANQAVADIVGADSVDEAIGLSIPEMYDDPEDLERMVEGLRDGGTVEAAEVAATTLDGDEIWVEVTTTGVEEDDERFFDGIVRDVTERRERDRELERTRELLAKAQEAADVGGWTFDFTGEPPYVPRWTDKMYEIMEVPRDEDPPPLDELQSRYHPEDRERRDEAVQRALAAGEPWDVEARIETGGGDFRWVRSIGEPSQRNGELVSARGALQDVTERKEREREIERQNERLHEFAEVVSHDLRNPLNVAMGRLQLAREDEDDAEHLDAVASAHDRIEAIIEDLLELATEGRAAMEIERVDAEAVSREAWGQVPTADASLVIESPGTVRADRTRLQQLLENLFRNAVDHGGDDVTVAVRDHPEGLAVDDDGPGLPDETRERLFQPGRSTSDDGTGFGLAIVDRIADAHGWRVATGESEEGGARFVLEGVDES